MLAVERLLALAQCPELVISVIDDHFASTINQNSYADRSFDKLTALIERIPYSKPYTLQSGESHCGG